MKSTVHDSQHWKVSRTKSAALLSRALSGNEISMRSTISSVVDLGRRKEALFFGGTTPLYLANALATQRRHGSWN